MALRLQTRLLVALALFLTPAFAWAGVDYWMERDEILANVDLQLQAKLTVIERDINNLVDQAGLVLEVMAEAPQLAEAPDECAAFLARYGRNEPGFPLLARVDADGKVRCASIPVEGAIDVSNLSAFGSTPANGIGIGHFPKGPLLAKPALAVARRFAPIDQEPDRFLLAAVNLSAVSATPSLQDLPQRSVFAVLDAGDLILARSTEPELFAGRWVGDRTVVVRARAGPGDVFEGAGFDGVQRLYVSSTPTFGGTAVMLILGVPSESAYAPARQEAARSFAFALGLAVLVGIGVPLAVHRVAVLPVKRLSHISTAIARGDATARVDDDLARRHDEIGSVAVTLNSTLDAMANRLRELDAANKRLAELDRLKSRIIDGIAHELRTPLLVVDLQSQRLLDRVQEPTPADQEAADRLRRGIARLRRVVEGTLRVADVQAGRVAATRENVDVAKLLDDVARRWRPDAARAGLDLTLSIGAESALGDAESLASVLDELVDNAIKFTPPGGSVAIRATRTPDCVELTVEDTGIGMDGPSEAGKQAFEPGEDHVRAGRLGIGVGLFLARAMVETMDGTIEVTEGPAGGTRVSVRLPFPPL